MSRPAKYIFNLIISSDLSTKKQGGLTCQKFTKEGLNLNVMDGIDWPCIVRAKNLPQKQKDCFLVIISTKVGFCATAAREGVRRGMTDYIVNFATT